jgi:hypothetical protein
MADQAIGRKGRRATSQKRGGGSSQKARRAHRPHRRRFAVHPESWKAYIEELLFQDAEGRTTFDGQLVSESDTRALYRWRKEGATPDLSKADAFLCRYYLSFSFFELWCELEERPVWANGPPPGFE